MSFRSKEERGPNLAILLAVIAIVGAVVFMVAVPKPSVQRLITKQRQDEAKIFDDADKAHKELAGAQKKIVSQVWGGPAQEIGPGALQKMNLLATDHKIKLSGFRPQRTSQASGLEMLPYSVTAEGSFTDVLRFVKAIEDPKNKLAVHEVQIASSEANSDQVTANIGLTAYRIPEAQHA